MVSFFFCFLKNSSLNLDENTYTHVRMDPRHFLAVEHAVTLLFRLIRRYHHKCAARAKKMAFHFMVPIYFLFFFFSIRVDYEFWINALQREKHPN